MWVCGAFCLQYEISTAYTCIPFVSMVCTCSVFHFQVYCGSHLHYIHTMYIHTVTVLNGKASIECESTCYNIRYVCT